MKQMCRRPPAFFLTLILITLAVSSNAQTTATSQLQPEYLWYEAEDMRGFTTQKNNEPVLNQSWQDLPKAKAPGWGMAGTGTSAEWSLGGGSEWGSAAASADETQATIYQDVEVPRAGDYKLWVRYADWVKKTENFVITIKQSDREVFRHEFGTADTIDPHDELAMYWEWIFAWDNATAKLDKGPARVSIVIEKAAGARRHVDLVVLTNDPSYTAVGRRKPNFAAMRYLDEWSKTRGPVSSLLSTPTAGELPATWVRDKVSGRDFMMPWNIAPDFWKIYEKPAGERPLYAFNAEPVEEFVQKYKGARDVPIFSSKLIVPVIYLNNFPALFKENSAFLRYLRETKAPFAVLINYGQAEMTPEDGQAAWKLLNGELKDQFLGWISGESVGHSWDEMGLQLTPAMSRKELLEQHRQSYSRAIAGRWTRLFHSDTGTMWDKLIPAQSSSSTSFAHALTHWGVRLLGVETAAVQPMFGMRIAFTRGAARQYGGTFLYYHAPNFGDTATTFTHGQSFAGPDHFYHSRYGTTMGPSLSWYRKSYYHYYMSGASAIYLEQGHDQFFKPGPGEHDFQLNPIGRITDEFVRFVERHPDRGTPYTPVAFLLDPAHGWEMTDYPHWPFGVSQINRSDRALRQLFGVAYYPGLVVEGEPPTGDRQAFVNGIFGNIFDVLVAADEPPNNGRAIKAVASPTPTPTPKPQKKLKATRGENKRESWVYEGSDTSGTQVIEPPSPQPSATPVRMAVNPSPLPVTPASAYSLDAYRAVVVGGHIDWSPQWIRRLTDYVNKGGTVVLNASQINGLPASLLGIQPTGATAEADTASCLSSGESPQNLSGQMFRYQKIELKGAQAFINSGAGDPLVTVNKVGKGNIIFAALPDLLGYDERITPFAAHMLTHVFADATPVKVRGDVEYLVNRNDKGWVVTLINNNGVYKPAMGMAQVDRTAYVTATISLPSQQLQSASDWISEKAVEVKNQNGEGVVTVSIAPGAISIVELKAR